MGGARRRQQTEQPVGEFCRRQVTGAAGEVCELAIDAVEVVLQHARRQQLLGREELVERADRRAGRSEGHPSELRSLMRISYAVFCLKKKKTTQPVTSL